MRSQTIRVQQRHMKDYLPALNFYILFLVSVTVFPSSLYLFFFLLCGIALRCCALFYVLPSTSTPQLFFIAIFDFFSFLHTLSTSLVFPVVSYLSTSVLSILLSIFCLLTFFCVAFLLYPVPFCTLIRCGSLFLSVLLSSCSLR